MKKPHRFGDTAQPSDYEVGYGKPPAETRFKKGQSGNPNGRPKGSRNRLSAKNDNRLGDIMPHSPHAPSGSPEPRAPR